MKFRCLIFILLSSLGSLCLGSEPRVRCDKAKVFSHLLIEKNASTSCDNIQGIEVFAGSIFSLSPTNLSNVSLVITDKHLKDSLNTGSGVFMGIDDDFENSLNQKGVLAHELGHTLFHKYFYRNFPDTRAYSELDEEIYNKVMHDSKTLDFNDECKSSECKDKLASIILLEQKRNSFESENSNLLDFLMEFVRPYNELVADAVAVLHFEDPNIMETVLQSINPERGEKKIKCRNFLIDTSGVYAHSDHCVLSGLRLRIYKSILEPAIKTGNKSQGLAELLKLVTDVIVNRYFEEINLDPNIIVNFNKNQKLKHGDIEDVNYLHKALENYEAERVVNEVRNNEKYFEVDGVKKAEGANSSVIQI